MPPSPKKRKQENKHKSLKPNSKIQTLTSLFAKQEKFNKEKINLPEDDDFIQITRVESKSKYFRQEEKIRHTTTDQTDTNNEAMNIELEDNCKTELKSRRLSLRKFSSKIHSEPSKLSCSTSEQQVINLIDSPVKKRKIRKQNSDEKQDEKIPTNCKKQLNEDAPKNKLSRKNSKFKKTTVETENPSEVHDIKLQRCSKPSTSCATKYLSGEIEGSELVYSGTSDTKTTKPNSKYISSSQKENFEEENHKATCEDHLETSNNKLKDIQNCDGPNEITIVEDMKYKSLHKKAKSIFVNKEEKVLNGTKLHSKESDKYRGLCCVDDSEVKNSESLSLKNSNKAEKSSKINPEKCSDLFENSTTVSSNNSTSSNVKSIKAMGKMHEKVKVNNDKYKEDDEEDDDNEEENDLDVAEEMEYRIPYYLENFQTVLSSVLEDESYIKLFNEQDLKTINDFKHLSEEAQKLYIRLFSRKLQWISCDKLKYPKIAGDLTPITQKLIDANFLISETELDDLEITLKILPAPDLKTLAKSYHVSATGLQKPDIINILIKKTKQNTIGSLFGVKGGITQAMLNKAKKLVGKCVRLQEEIRGVFVRVLMLFSIATFSLDEEGTVSGQNQLFQMLMVNIGRVVYPTYKINKQTDIYMNRESVLLYEKALQHEADFMGCIERSKWEDAYQIYLIVKQLYHDLPQSSISYDSKLPDFLRRFTTGHLLVRILSAGIEVLQRRKDYKGAIDLIQLLLDQKVYCLDYHGYWWERMALNLDAHMKNPIKSLEVIKKGLDDINVRVGHRLALYQRAEKICQTTSLKLKHRITEFSHEEVIEAPKKTIEGRIIPYAVPGIKHKFMTQASYTEDVTMCNVEQVVQDYYKEHDYPEGLHAEGSIVSSLFTLFFWDILFMDIPDAFHSSFQTNPLDKMSEDFYRRRKKDIDTRLLWLEESSLEELKECSEKTWNDNCESTVSGISWERLQSLDYIQGLIECIGGKLLCGILSRYAQDPRHTRSGFPDLTLWNTENKTFKIVEVKGPGDRLSHKQILWLSYLCKLGIDAEVCHVKAIGAKKLLKSKD